MNGILVQILRRNPVYPPSGFGGFTVEFLGLTPVRVEDYRRRPLAGVTLVAENPTSGNSFETTTDSNGSAVMQLDAITAIQVIKDSAVESFDHNGEAQHTVAIDRPLMI